MFKGVLSIFLFHQKKNIRNALVENCADKIATAKQKKRNHLQEPHPPVVKEEEHQKEEQTMETCHEDLPRVIDNIYEVNM
jgi:CO dehydrogenase/acetyl-CoA synthase beta subunit